MTAFPMSILKTVCVSITFLLSAASICHAVIRKRDSRSALWWVTISIFFPIAGPVLYYFFGINRIERKAHRLRRRRSMRSWSSQKNDVGPDILPLELRRLNNLAQLSERSLGRPLLDGNTVTPYMNGDEAYPQMIKAIDQAEKSVGLMTYIYRHDEVGRLFVDALARAVKRGVQVRVLVDSVGSGFSWWPLLSACKKNKIRAERFLPTMVPWHLSYVNLRNHRKLLTVDGRIAFTGGMNIHRGHLVKGKLRSRTQDIQFKVEGPVVAQLQESFQDDWYFTCGEKLDGMAWFPALHSTGAVFSRAIADGPDEDFEKLRWTLLGAISHARTSIRIVTPYFIPDHAFISALNVAAMSGVKVDILLPRVSDLYMVKWASTAMLWQVLIHGCRVWSTPAPFDHAKMTVVDGEWALIGSSNWDPRSLRLNFELNVECYSRTFATSLEQIIDEKKEKAREITLRDVDSRAFPIKLRDGLARLFAPHL